MSNINPNKTAKTSAPPDRFSTGWLESLDGRLSLARDLRERFNAVCEDLGGRDQLSYMQRSLVERGLWLEYWLSQQEKELAGGNEFDVGKWVQAANSLQGIYSKLGLQRRAAEVPDLQTWIQRRTQEKAEASNAE